MFHRHKVRVCPLATCLLLVWLLVACAGTPATPAQPTLTVFAAASLTDAFEVLGEQFEADHPGTTVQFSFAASQELRTQLEQGAAADVFASADNKNLPQLVEKGLIERAAVRDFATNQLVVIVPTGNPAQVESLAELARPGVKVVIAAPAVPIGGYTRRLLANLSEEPSFGATFADQVLANVISEELTVRQVVTKVQLGEADAGVVYESDVTPAVADALVAIPIPEESNVTATYQIAALGNASQAKLATEFVEFVLAEGGQSILQGWGFGPPPAP